MNLYRAEYTLVNKKTLILFLSVFVFNKYIQVFKPARKQKSCLYENALTRNCICEFFHAFI